MLYLIHGFYIQRQQWLGLSESREESVVKSGLGRFMFSGVICPNKHNNHIVGQVNDHFGPSTLSDVEISEEKVIFTKKYDNLNSFPIRYEFTKMQGDLWWEGRYSYYGAEGGDLARCVINKVPLDFFQT